MRLNDLLFPDSQACRGALDVATTYHTPSLLNHSIRAYLWAAAHAQRNGIVFDAELLYVSAVLHDIGLVAEFDSHTVPFEEAGGHVVQVFGAGASWPPERRTRASEIIIRHMWDEVPIEQDVEGHLLELATAIDISGRGIDEIPAGLRREVLERYPRLNLAKEFTACISEQGARKPGSSAARAVAGGVADHIGRNPLDA